MDPKTGQIDMDKILRAGAATGPSAVAEHREISEAARPARLSELVSRLKERNSAFDMSMQEARDAAMLLVEQDRATIKGDMVAAV